jgi:transcriptional regulator with XRE-family HTH domain
MQGYSFPVIDLQKTGKNLKEICQAHNLAPKDLQQILQLGSIKAVYNWYSGLRLPSIDNLLAISKLLQVTINDILVETTG